MLAVLLALALSRAAGSNPCTASGEMAHEGRTIRCVHADGELHDLYAVSDGAITCRATDANSCTDAQVAPPQASAQSLDAARPAVKPAVELVARAVANPAQVAMV